MSTTTFTNTATESPFEGPLKTSPTTEQAVSTTATDTSFAGPLWLKKDVGALYAKGEVHTGPFSMPLLRMAGMDKLPVKDSYSILDLCCGSGVTTSELQVLFKEQKVQDKTNLVCGDLSAGQLEYLDARIKQQGWKNTRTALMNAQKTEQPSEAFDYITCAQGLMIIPDSMAALDECHRMLKPNGTFALSVWFKEHWITHVRDALSQLPGLPYWPQTSEELTGAWAQGPWENPHYVEAMLHRHGFSNIEVQIKSIFIELKDADDFYEVYDAFIEWVIERFWTPEESRMCKPLVRYAVVKHMNEKFGKGNPFKIEKICMLATCKKP